MNVLHFILYPNPFAARDVLALFCLFDSNWSGPVISIVVTRDLKNKLQ